MNLKNKAVELRNSQFTTEPGALQKGEDFIRAITYGFDVDDAIALLRLDDLYDFPPIFLSISTSWLTNDRFPVLQIHGGV
jgi:rRNA processing protein Krr1/Pno1